MEILLEKTAVAWHYLSLLKSGDPAWPESDGVENLSDFCDESRVDHIKYCRGLAELEPSESASQQHLVLPCGHDDYEMLDMAWTCVV